MQNIRSHIYILLVAAMFLASFSGMLNAQQPAAPNQHREATKSEQPALPVEVLASKIDVAELTIRLIPLTKDSLAALASEWLKIVKAKTEAVMEVQIKILNTEGEIERSSRTKLTELIAERKDLFEKYSAVIKAWETKGGEAVKIAELRAYHNSIIVEETRTADFKTLLAQVVSWIKDEDGGVSLVKSTGIVVIALVILLFLAKILRRFARRWVGRIPNLSTLLQVFLVAVIYWIVLAVGLMVVLSALGVDITPVFALIGGLSFIIAFAFQDTLGNLASGLMIMINSPFDEDDYVDIGGVSGTVKSVSIVATTVITPDNQVIIIPNKNVWGNIIINVTASDTRRVDLLFCISYEDSIPDAIHVLEEIVQAHSLVLNEPEVNIRVHELADSSVNLICRPWVKTEDYWTVYWDLMRQVKEQFDAKEISIPFPQRDIHCITGE